MPSSLTTDSLRQGFAKITTKMQSFADELNALDAVLGDGDLGVTMTRGANSVNAELQALPNDVGLALLKCAQAFTKISGSTLGTLLATGLMSAAKSTKGRTEIPWIELSPILAGALAAMSARSGGTLGDKTILDVIDATRAATDGLSDPAAMATAANAAAAATIEKFRNLPAKQGRARIFAEKSIGLDDPGMIAFKRILESLV